MVWNYIETLGLLIYKSNDFYYSKDVCICSFSNTLIKEYPRSRYTHLFTDTVTTLLKKIDNEKKGSSIIIIENQFGCPVRSIKNSVKKFFELIDNEKNTIPFYMIFILKKNKYKKPQTNIWKYLETQYKQNNKQLKKQNSIYIGCNAGRSYTDKFNKDKSDVDRAFCKNAGIYTFLTPEQVFLEDYSVRKWKWNNSIISVEDRKKLIASQKKNTTEPSFTEIFRGLPKNKEILILVSGPPVSGKTTLSNRIKKYLLNKGILSKQILCFDINNYDESEIKLLQMWKKFLKEQEEEKGNGKKIIIIVGEFADSLIRKDFIKPLKNKFIIFFDINTNKNICKLLNQFKLQISKSINITETSLKNINYYFRQKKNVDCSKEKIHKYVKYPLLIREREEIYYYY